MLDGNTLFLMGFQTIEKAITEATKNLKKDSQSSIEKFIDEDQPTPPSDEKSNYSNTHVNPTQNIKPTTSTTEKNERLPVRVNNKPKSHEHFQELKKIKGLKLKII